MPGYRIKQGDCLSKVARNHGFLSKTLWDLPENKSLAKKRDPDILCVGDVLFIPDKRNKIESRATGQRNSFRRKGELVYLRLQILDDDEPRANVVYEMTVGALIFEGSTDSDGYLEHQVPASAERACLIIEDDDIYEIALGGLDPIEENLGVQHRLQNLGYYDGALDKDIGDVSKSALLEFQRKYELTETSEADEVTRAKLVEVFGS